MLTLGSLEAIPPRERRWIEQLIKKYDELAAEIDQRYEAGDLEGIEDLEQQAEYINEILIALHDVYSEHEGDVGEGVSLEEQLVWAWNNPQAFKSRDDWINHMKDVVRTALLWQGKDVEPTEDQVIELAKDAANRRAELIRRYRKGRGPK